MMMICRSAVVLLAVWLPVQHATDVAVCPGEGDRYGDYKCNHDETHRVCAQLLDASGTPLAWGSSGQNFWQITGQQDFMWDAEIRANHGDSWCICMWATARLIDTVGCENVHLRCDSTDVSYVMSSYNDGGVELAPAKECLAKKCPQLAVQKLNDRSVPDLSDGAAKDATHSATYLVYTGAALMVAALAVVANRYARASRLTGSLLEDEPTIE